LKKNKDEKKYEEAQKELFELIGKYTTAEIPPIFIEDELKGMIDNIKIQGLQRGFTSDKYLEVLKKTEQELKDEMKKDAEKTVLSRLGLQAMIRKDDDIKVSDEEIELEISKELSRIDLQAKQQKLKKEDIEVQKASFKKGADGWFKVENRMNIRKFFEKHLRKK